MNKPSFNNNPVFHQINCAENRNGVLDLRQAEGIKKYQPDIVILEYPSNSEMPYFELNDFGALEKPKELVAQRLRPFSKELLKKDPWVAADIIMWQEIAKLWARGKQVFVYPTDGTFELISEWREVWNHMYPLSTQNWVWWVQIYLRERLMANNVNYVIRKHQDMQKPIVNIYLQNFHWQHVKFLLTHTKTDEIWQFYFGKFSSEVTKETITNEIQRLNPVFFKYWIEYSDFV
jgi:hypothetical protein